MSIRREQRESISRELRFSEPSWMDSRSLHSERHFEAVIYPNRSHSNDIVRPRSCKNSDFVLPSSPHTSPTMLASSLASPQLPRSSPQLLSLPPPPLSRGDTILPVRLISPSSLIHCWPANSSYRSQRSGAILLSRIVRNTNNIQTAMNSKNEMIFP